MEGRSNLNNATSFALLEQLVYIDNFMANSGSSNSAGELTPNLDMDGQLSMDLAAFADESFIFPDEEKKDHPSPDGSLRINEDDFSSNFNINNNNHEDIKNSKNTVDFDLQFSKGVPSNNQGNQNNFDSDKHPDNILLYRNGKQAKNEPLSLDHDTASDGVPSSNTELNISQLPKFPVPPGAKSSLESAGLSLNQIDLLSALIAQHQSKLNAYENQHNNIVTNPRIDSVRQHNNLYINNFHGMEESSEKTRSLSSISNSSVETPTLDTPTKRNELYPSGMDKRKRNTEASARFRIKKKMKEKQMEDRIMKLSETIKDFETKIQQLEMENKLLKNLIIEKGSQQSDDELRRLKEKAKSN